MRFNNEDYLKAFPRTKSEVKVETESAVENFKPIDEPSTEKAVEEFTQVNSDDGEHEDPNESEEGDD